MPSHSISCPINKEQPTRPALTRDPEKLSRALYLKCLNDILAMQWTKWKTLYFRTFAAQRRICWDQRGVVRRRIGRHRACWLERQKIGMCPYFPPIFDLSSNFDSRDSQGFLDISVSDAKTLGKVKVHWCMTAKCWKLARSPQTHCESSQLSGCSWTSDLVVSLYIVLCCFQCSEKFIH